MGHRKLETTMIYTKLIKYQEDEWTCRVAKNMETTQELIECGFDHVTNFEDNMLFRKRK